MRLKEHLRRQGVALDLWLSRRTLSWGSLPLLHHLHRDVTAHVRLGDASAETDLEISVEFQSPYLRLPLEVRESQIGKSGDEAFTPAAFRLFDWHTWAHIDGRMAWQEERVSETVAGDETVIRGFRYHVDMNRLAAATLGLRVAEGVEGTIGILVGDGMESVRFQPQYWILDLRSSTRRVTPIRDTELAMLLVSLAELSSDRPATHEKAVDRLEQWATHKKQKRSGEQLLVELLIRIRDWGPAGAESMFAGVTELLRRLDIAGQERILFEFYAENWGVRNNPAGRRIAVNLLQALATKKARFTLEAILEFVRNQAVGEDEVAGIRRAIDHVEAALAEEPPKTHLE